MKASPNSAHPTFQVDFRRTSGGHTYPREVANQRQKRTNPMKTLSPDRKFDDETSVKLHARRRA